MQYRDAHLDVLENQSIYILGEAYRKSKRLFTISRRSEIPYSIASISDFVACLLPLFQIHVSEDFSQIGISLLYINYIVSICYLTGFPDRPATCSSSASSSRDPSSSFPSSSAQTFPLFQADNKTGAALFAKWGGLDRAKDSFSRSIGANKGNNNELQTRRLL